MCKCALRVTHPLAQNSFCPVPKVGGRQFGLEKGSKKTEIETYEKY